MKSPTHWQNIFFHNFLEQLRDFRLSPEQISRLVWRPFSENELKIFGEDRDTDFAKISLTPEEIKKSLSGLPESPIKVNLDFLRERKIVVLIIPGFTHHTLRNLSLHEQMYDKESPHHIIRFRFDDKKPQVLEDTFNTGEGLKIGYMAYPRANAHSRHVLPGLFDLIHKSKTLRKWVQEEGRKIVFMGYSYGSPLTLEMLARMNRKETKDDFILANTVGFLSLCGDIGGSHLADYVVDKNSKYNIYKALDLAKKYKILAAIFGLKTEQDKEDILGGAISLGHEERQKSIKLFKDSMPKNIKYFSISAIMPQTDYVNSVIRNFDDWSMHKQSLAYNNTTIYNDGQVSLSDTWIPDFKNVPKENRINLGAVRTHHWGVSYKTFNFGNNKFPRVAFYQALMKTFFMAGIG